MSKVQMARDEGAPNKAPSDAKQTKLAELRALVGQIPAFKTKRKGFTAKQRKAVRDAFGGLCACGCEEPLEGEVWDIDHVIPIAIGGAHEPGNWVPLIKAHHVRKTAQDRKAIAKCERIIARENGTRRERQPIHGKPLQGRPFPKDLRRKFNGQVVEVKR